MPPSGGVPAKRKAPRNDLNDLDPKQWLISTKSVWKGTDYHLESNDDVRFKYIRNLVRFFTKRDGTVLNLAREHPPMQDWITKVCREECRQVETDVKDGVDFILVRERDGSTFKAFRAYRDYISSDCPSKYAALHAALNVKKYLCVVVQDFHFATNDAGDSSPGSELVLYHGDLAAVAVASGFHLKGLIVWMPATDPGAPHPTTPCPPGGIVHEYIMIFEKGKENAESTHVKALDVDIREPALLSPSTRFYPGFSTSIPPPRDRFKAQHPATFPEPDVKLLMQAFVHAGSGASRPVVLDPFCGVGSALVAGTELGFASWGIELTGKWIGLTVDRFASMKPPVHVRVERGVPASMVPNDCINDSHALPVIIHGDARACMKEFPRACFDFIVTSPPYWGILTKKLDHKTRKERASKGFETKYTVEGEDATFASDIGNIPEYGAFLEELRSVYREAWRVLKPGRYAAVIVSDFRDGGMFYLYHCKTATLLQDAGFTLVSTSILHQDSKNLYPYGYPFSFVSNIHHQFIVIVRKRP